MANNTTSAGKNFLIEYTIKAAFQPLDKPSKPSSRMAMKYYAPEKWFCVFLIIFSK